MTAEYFRTMFGYTSWAWRRVLDQVAQVSQDEYIASPFRSYPSMRATLVHALAAEMRYLLVWKGEPFVDRPDEITLPTIVELREAWAGQEKAREAFLAKLTDQDCTRVITQLNRNNEETKTPLWVLMTQAVTHHMQHRSEIALQVSQLGHSPGDLDLSRYYRERN